MTENYTQEELKEAYFIQLVYTFQAAAMQQMGKIVNPITNQVEKNMEQAKHSIDMLAMLETKTSGNLTEREQKILEKTLFELRMNYVDEMKVTGEEEEDREEKQEKAKEKKQASPEEEENQNPSEPSDEVPPEKEVSEKEPSEKKSPEKESAQQEP